MSTAADPDDRALLDAVDELWRRRLLRQHSPTTYDFAHDLLRDAAYEQLSPPQRQLLHRRIADALEPLHAGDPEVVAAGLAEQYEQSGQREPAIRYHAMAAESATQVFALDDAVRHHRRALELLSHLPASAARDRRELELLEAGLPRLLALPARLVGQAEDHPAQAGQICVARAGALASAGQLRGSVHWFERVEPSTSPVSRSPTGSGCFSRTVSVP